MSSLSDPGDLLGPSCPAPLAPSAGGRITLSHGAGAGASARLFDDLIWPRLGSDLLGERHDGAVFEAERGRIAFTTDSYVVRPLFFPGGDIGSLAVHGTLNDLAMCGARPQALSCGLILEEGLELSILDRVLDSLGTAAQSAGVPIATGDTKVVEHGKGDAIFINTAGVGVVAPGRDLRPARVAPGDAILVSGSIGLHGAAIMSVREGLSFDSDIRSDSANLCGLTEQLLEAVPGIHCLRDPTRGGVGAALHELASAAQLEVVLDELALPVDEPVLAACELLGLDPLYLACEGRCLAFVAEQDAERALEMLRAHPLGRAAARIGSVQPGVPRVVVKTRIGTRRMLPLPAGEPLPRIC